MSGMSELEVAILDDVFRAILGVRRSIDLPFARYSDPQDFINQRELMNDLEALRFTLRALRRPDRQAQSVNSYLLDEAREILDFVIENPAFSAFESRPFRPMPSHRSLQDSQLDLGLTDEELNLGEVLLYCRSRLSHINREEDLTTKFSPGVFRSLIPDQKIAPTQFRVEDDKIKIEPNPSSVVPGSEEGAKIARSEVAAQSSEIVENLESSNCHPRLTTAFRDLRDHLLSDANAIKLGLCAVTANSIAGQFANEISDATLGLILGHLQSVHMLLGQYKDWQQFCENALVADLDDNATAMLVRATDELAHKLSENPSLADPEVPKTLVFIRECLSNPKMAAARTGYAALATIENLVSAVFSYSSDLIDETVRKSIKTASIGLGGAIGLAAIGLFGAELIAPIAGITPNGQWVLELIKMLKAP